MSAGVLFTERLTNKKLTALTNPLRHIIKDIVAIIHVICVHFLVQSLPYSLFKGYMRVGFF